MKLDLNFKTNDYIYDVVEKNNVTFLQYPLLSQTGMVEHGISTREGGVSEGIYRSMNLSFGRGDDPEKVMENFRRMADALNVSVDNMVMTRQTHTTNVKVVDASDCGKGITKERDYDDIDGLITNVPGICLVSLYADCVPLIFFDPVKKVVATSHSGWRGTVNRMGEATILEMQKEFGCDPADILAAIGPSICQDCYEVSEDVIDMFRQAFKEEQYDSLFYAKPNNKYQLNLWKANEIILRESGILPEHLSVNNLCTCCNSEHMFSHRASKGKRGNLAAFIALKEDL